MEKDSDIIREKASRIKSLLADFKATMAKLGRKHREEMKMLKDEAAQKRLEEVRKKLFS